MTDLKQKTEHFLALADAATPGPWQYEQGGGHSHNRVIGAESSQINGWPERRGGYSNASYSERICENLGDTDLPRPSANVALIIAAPDMAAHLRALQAEVDRLHAECEALRVDVEPWVYTSEKLHPDKPGRERYEQIPCVILKNREISLKVWNCEHLVWDDETGDDFYCAASDVTAWKIVRPPAMRAAMDREREPCA